MDPPAQQLVQPELLLVVVVVVIVIVVVVVVVVVIVVVVVVLLVVLPLALSFSARPAPQLVQPEQNECVKTIIICMKTIIHYQSQQIRMCFCCMCES